MANPVAYFVIVVGIGMLVTLLVVVPVTVSSGADNSPPDNGFESGHASQHYLQSVCPCYQGEPDFATTEREISQQFFKQTQSIPDPRYLSTWAWAWGQFIDHDIVISGESTELSDCYNISFNENINLKVTRVEARVTSGCREPKNNLSPMIDASTVYSDYHNPERLALLRAPAPNNCELKMDELGYPLDQMCGDVRCNEHVMLHTLHTIFAKEHNRLCGVLRKDHRFTTEEQRFWKARSIVYSIIQHITYTQWLPSLFGSQRSLLSSLSTQPAMGDGLRLTNAFSVAAFRFGHSMVQDNLGPYPLAQLFFQPNFLQTHGLEEVIRLATAQRAERVDQFVVDTLRDMLFGTFGMDLVARNLFRAREVGIGTYKQLCDCYGTQPTSTLGPNVRDPLLGLLSEPLVPESSLPRTIAVIVAEQFRRLRDNDPNFYTKRAKQIGSPYYSIVTSSTLANVLARNSNVGNLKNNVFFTN